MHDAYEEAAKSTGWETQERSRVDWVAVPEANKQTMRAAVRAVLTSAAMSENLAQRDRDIAQAERERIIKLLEEAEPCECNPSWSYRCDTHFRIALIKGEEQ
jgi:hypothetical protein